MFSSTTAMTIPSEEAAWAAQFQSELHDNDSREPTAADIEQGAVGIAGEVPTCVLTAGTNPFDLIPPYKLGYEFGTFIDNQVKETFGHSLSEMTGDYLADKFPLDSLSKGLRDFVEGISGNDGA
jgi:hypothetical protein